MTRMGTCIKRIFGRIAGTWEWLFSGKMAYVMMALAALVVELFLFNLGTVRSLGYRPVDVTSQVQFSGLEETQTPGEYVVTGEEAYLAVEGLDLDLRNLHVQLQAKDTYMMPVRIHLWDEGNSGGYKLSERMLLQDVPVSSYISVFPYGNVHRLQMDLSCEEGTHVLFGGLQLNERRPLRFSVIRFLVMFAVAALWWAFRRAGRLHLVSFSVLFSEKSRSERRASRLGMLLCILLSVSALTAIWQSNSETWQTLYLNQQYQFMTMRLAEGEVTLEDEVDPHIFELENPYDHSARNEIGLSYFPWDTAYYNGHYYSYFGIAPIVVCYLPYYLVTGQLPGDADVMLVFGIGMVLGSYFLVYQMLRRWAKEAPLYLWPLLSCILAFSETYVYLYMRPEMYNLPGAAANLFLFWGMGLWLWGLNTSGKARGAAYFFGSLCFALIAGSRPHMVLIAALAIPLFWEAVIRKRELFSRSGILPTVLICLPFVLVAAGLMYYNKVRFGSPFEFGAQYNLTTNDITHRSFNLDRLGGGIIAFLLQPPTYMGTFPYLRESLLSSQYMGKLYIEFIYGGIAANHLLIWLLPGMGYAKKTLRKSGVYALMVSSILLGLLLTCVDATMAGILERYASDLTFLFLFPACLLVLVLMNHWNGESGEKPTAYYLLGRFVLAAFLVTAAFAFFMIFINKGDYNLFVANPERYEYVRSFFLL